MDGPVPEAVPETLSAAGTTSSAATGAVSLTSGNQPGRPQPEFYWRVAWGLPAPGFSHQDATALCLIRSTGRPAEPVEIDRG